MLLEDTRPAASIYVQSHVNHPGGYLEDLICNRIKVYSHKKVVAQMERNVKSGKYQKAKQLDSVNKPAFWSNFFAITTGYII